jgi:hypothetical protein
MGRLSVTYCINEGSKKLVKEERGWIEENNRMLPKPLIQ